MDGSLITKAISTSAKAVAKIPNVKLDIVGGGEERESLTELINSLLVSERVQIRGSLTQDELAHALKECDLMCLSSIERTEAFGLVILEAARMGKPALVTRVEGSGMNWLVEDGVTGWEAQPGSEQGLADALNRILSERHALRELGSRAQARFRNEFQINMVARSIHELYFGITYKNSTSNWIQRLVNRHKPYTKSLRSMISGKRLICRCLTLVRARTQQVSVDLKVKLTPKQTPSE